MKKFLINIGLFGLFAVVFYLVIMPLWSSFLPSYMSKNVRSCMGCYGHTFTRMQDAQKTKNVDVLIVGSSHAYRGVDPRILKKVSSVILTKQICFAYCHYTKHNSLCQSAYAK